MAEAKTAVNNGVNTAALIAAARRTQQGAAGRAVSSGEHLANGRRARTSLSTVEGFYGLGQEQHHKKSFSLTPTIQKCSRAEDKGATGRSNTSWSAWRVADCPASLPLHSIATSSCARVTATIERRYGHSRPSWHRQRHPQLVLAASR